MVAEEITDASEKLAFVRIASAKSPTPPQAATRARLDAILVAKMIPSI